MGGLIEEKAWAPFHAKAGEKMHEIEQDVDDAFSLGECSH